MIKKSIRPTSGRIVIQRVQKKHFFHADNQMTCKYILVRLKFMHYYNTGRRINNAVLVANLSEVI